MHLHFRQEKCLYTAECGNRIVLSGHFGVTVMLRVANRQAQEPGSPKGLPGVAGSTVEGAEIWQSVILMGEELFYRWRFYMDI